MGVIAEDLDNVAATVVETASGIIEVTDPTSVWIEVDAGDGETIQISSRE